MLTVLSTGEEPIDVSSSEWVDVLEIPGSLVFTGTIIVLNEGDFPGFWRFKLPDGETPAARLPSGGGEAGDRKAAINIPVKDMSGAVLQIKKPLLGGNLERIFAFAVRE